MVGQWEPQKEFPESLPRIHCLVKTMHSHENSLTCLCFSHKSLCINFITMSMSSALLCWIMESLCFAVWYAEAVFIMDLATLYFLRRIA